MSRVLKKRITKKTTKDYKEIVSAINALISKRNQGHDGAKVRRPLECKLKRKRSISMKNKLEERKAQLKAELQQLKSQRRALKDDMKRLKREVKGLKESPLKN
jgi:hypothetical protein